MAYYVLFYFLVAYSTKSLLTVATDVRFQPNTVGSGVSGILQVYHNGEWGTVCNDDWDMKDTMVACKQLGYAKAAGFWKYGKGGGRIWLSWMHCDGSETSLENCNRGSGWGGSHEVCKTHVHDVGVVCSTYTGIQEKNKLKVRLQPDTIGFGVAGILQVYNNQQWGTICIKSTADWTKLNTDVACRTLGFDRAIGLWHQGRGRGKIWNKKAQCDGDENSLLSCNLEERSDAECKDKGNDVGIVCSDYQVRLVNGTDSNEGRIEVMANGAWGTVCGDYGWTIENSHVICRMLGHARAFTNSNFGAGSKSQPIWLKEVWCKGCEMTITECQISNFGLSSCNHKNDVGVVCLPEGNPNIRVRLVDKDKNFVRRVEVRYYGIWRPICPTNWDIRDAHVICRMQGYQKAAVATTTSKGRNDKVWLVDVNCSGNETSIEDCKNLMWNLENKKPCSFGNLRAGVVCLTENVTLGFHIVQRRIDYAGRLEVDYYDKKKRNLCAENLNLNAAHVICRMLNYEEAVAISPWGKQNGVSFSLSLRCNGKEKSTDQCDAVKVNEVDSCNSKEVAGIVCKGGTEYADKHELRLVGGSGHHEGRVEVLLHGVWGTVCSTGWDMLDANVVCRMKNYTGAITAYKKFPESSGSPIWLTGFNCKGSENTTNECDHEVLNNLKTTSCSHSDDVGVVCYSEKGYLQVGLELGNTSSFSKGRVKIRIHNETGTIDDEQWDIKDAHVVCRMLGFSRAIASISLLRGESDKVLLAKVQCNGTEKSLEMCDHGGWGAPSQNHLKAHDAGVICEESQAVQAKMVDGSGSDGGAVAGLSVLIVILILAIVAASVWYFFKLKAEKNKHSDKTQGLQMESQRLERGTADDVTDDYYQAPPSREGQNRYVTSQESDRAAARRGRNPRNVQESEDSSMYLEVRR